VLVKTTGFGYYPDEQPIYSWAYSVLNGTNPALEDSLSQIVK
jgi:hypothetical protein